MGTNVFPCIGAQALLNHSKGELTMKVYRVGGAIRDKLLNFPSVENDWVVVGATSSQLIDLQYRPVGRNFPVFIHPTTGEEYALARTEMKTGHGYKGFAFHADPSVTLEQDLMRRDLTINAIAEDSNGNLIDPSSGQRDLRLKVLRHVSSSFVEDPVRVLRTARFAARYHHLGFSVASETMQLMRSISEGTELDHLTPERVWKETEKALLEESPHIFIKVLRQCGALKSLFPELDQLFGVKYRHQTYQDSDRGYGALTALEKTAKLSQSGPIRFAVLVHSIGESINADCESSSKPNRLDLRVSMLKTLCDRLKMPKKYRELSMNFARYYKTFFLAQQLEPSKLLKLISAVSDKSSTCKFENFLLCCKGISRDGQGDDNEALISGRYVKSAIKIANSVVIASPKRDGLQGREIGQEIQKLQLAKLTEFKKNFSGR